MRQRQWLCCSEYKLLHLRVIRLLEYVNPVSFQQQIARPSQEEKVEEKVEEEKAEKAEKKEEEKKDEEEKDEKEDSK